MFITQVAMQITDNDRKPADTIASSLALGSKLLADLNSAKSAKSPFAEGDGRSVGLLFCR